MRLIDVQRDIMSLVEDYVAEQREVAYEEGRKAGYQEGYDDRDNEEDV